MGKIPRTNIYIEHFHTDGDSLYPHIYMHSNEIEPDGIGIDFLEFLEDKTYCVKCNEKITDLRTSHKCINSKSSFSDIKISCHFEFEFIAHLTRAGKRKASRKSAGNRQVIKKLTPHRYTKAQIKDIFSTQNGMCYYCLCQLKDEKFHIDHFEALANGGDDSVHNIVIACQSCNMSKRASDSKKFLKQAIGKLNEDEALVAKSIHKAVKKYKKTQP